MVNGNNRQDAGGVLGEVEQQMCDNWPLGVLLGGRRRGNSSEMSPETAEGGSPKNLRRVSFDDNRC